MEIYTDDVLDMEVVYTDEKRSGEDGGSIRRLGLKWWRWSDVHIWGTKWWSGEDKDGLHW